MSKKKNALLIQNPLLLDSIVIAIIGIVVLNSIQMRYFGSAELPTISGSSLKFKNMMIIGLIGMIALRFIYFINNPRYPLFGRPDFTEETIFDTVYATIAYFLIQIIVMTIRDQFFQVATVDVYSFFVAGGIAEEVVFRGFLVMLLQYLLNFIFPIKNDSLLEPANLLSAVFSGVFFAAFHTNFWGDPWLLAMTGIGGFSQALFYIKSKNLTVVFISHGLINISAASTIIQGL